MIACSWKAVLTSNSKQSPCSILLGTALCKFFRELCCHTCSAFEQDDYGYYYYDQSPALDDETNFNAELSASPNSTD